jgi:hypothetical protein
MTTGGPVVACRRHGARQGIERRGDVRERDAHALCHADESDATQHVARVPALVALGAPAGNQAFRFVEVQRRYRHAASLRHFADAQAERDSGLFQRESFIVGLYARRSSASPQSTQIAP